MAEPKTRPTGKNVAAFLDAIEDDRRRKDCQTVLQLMKRATKAEPILWGTSIVGFGSYCYRYASGREADWPVTGFAPRKNDVTLYIMGGFSRYDALMDKLGKYTNGKSCLHIKRLVDVDLDVLEQLVKESVKHVTRRHA
jgi:hypothetical protein